MLEFHPVIKYNLNNHKYGVSTENNKLIEKQTFDVLRALVSR